MLQPDTYCRAGPDATLTICLWQQGFAITDPNPGHRLKQDTLCTLMDPDPAVSTLPGPYAKANDMITNALQDVLGTCSPDCQARPTQCGRRIAVCCICSHRRACSSESVAACTQQHGIGVGSCMGWQYLTLGWARAYAAHGCQGV